MTEKSLNGRWALVTGGMGGLGRDIARSLGRAGAAVVLTGLEPTDQGEQLAASMEAETGATVVYKRADLGDLDEIGRLFKSLGDDAQSPDIIVNNAVVRHSQPLLSISPREWNSAIAVNVSAPFHCIRFGLPTMLGRGWGRIINMSSIYAARGIENRVDYVTTKTALSGLTRAVAIETAKSGITCNAIAPGVVASPPVLERIAAEAEKKGLSIEDARSNYLSSRIPNARFTLASSIGDTIVFLCSAAGADITGTIIAVDGGWQAS